MVAESFTIASPLLFVVGTRGVMAQVSRPGGTRGTRERRDLYAWGWSSDPSSDPSARSVGRQSVTGRRGGGRDRAT